VKDDTSKLPSCRWVTGIPSGDNSADRTFAEAAKALFTALSGRWKAGLKLEMIPGVRRRTDGLRLVVD
jgi:hypothetical protein